jgi:hypothetical protein
MWQILCWSRLYVQHRCKIFGHVEYTCGRFPVFNVDDSDPPFTQYLLSDGIAYDGGKCFDPFSHWKTTESHFSYEEFTSLPTHQSRARLFVNVVGGERDKCLSELLKFSHWVKQNCQERLMKSCFWYLWQIAVLIWNPPANFKGGFQSGMGLCNVCARLLADKQNTVATKKKVTMALHPSYSPDLALMTSSCFPEWNHSFEGIFFRMSLIFGSSSNNHELFTCDFN